MLVDGNIGGTVDGTEGGNLDVLNEQVDAAQRAGLDGVWSTETGHDPFLSLLLAARQSPTLQIGTAIAVAFARNPMTVAMTAFDMHTYSGGRFLLGLGSQIEAHITRRFSMPWSAPAPRMREFIAALRAIWTSWQTGDRLYFKGDFYQHTLMSPMFRPSPNPLGTPPVLLAAVGPAMTKVAAQVADGLLVHGFTTERYLREVTLPMVTDGLGERPRSEFVVNLPVLIATGSTSAELAVATQAVRAQLAFYGSTKAYRPVLEMHGWGDLQTELHGLSKQGDWKTMTGLIDDSVLGTFAAVGSPAEAGAQVRRRFADVIDRLTLYTPYKMTDEVRTSLVAAIRGA
jgi:probable F420-dependent oxidoreductase